jgi:hypothetical protein
MVLCIDVEQLEQYIAFDKNLSEEHFEGKSLSMYKLNNFA